MSDNEFGKFCGLLVNNGIVQRDAIEHAEHYDNCQTVNAIGVVFDAIKRDFDLVREQRDEALRELAKATDLATVMRTAIANLHAECDRLRGERDEARKENNDDT